MTRNRNEYQISQGKRKDYKEARPISKTLLFYASPTKNN